VITGATARPLLGRRLRRRWQGLADAVAPPPLILMYHRVAEPTLDQWQLCVSPANFATQMQALRRRRRPMALSELTHELGHGRCPRAAVVVTFDDGYSDNLSAALPVLEAFDVPATVFCTAGVIGGDAPFWWDRLAGLLLRSPPLPPQLTLAAGAQRRSFTLDAAAHYSADDRASDRRRRGDDDPASPRLRFYREVWAWLRPLAGAERACTLEKIAAWCGGDGPDVPRPLSRPEARTLAASVDRDRRAHGDAPGAVQAGTGRAARRDHARQAPARDAGGTTCRELRLPLRRPGRGDRGAGARGRLSRRLHHRGRAGAPQHRPVPAAAHCRRRLGRSDFRTHALGTAVRSGAPTVSVIVCFLDEERFLGEAVASVRAQTFSDWELLLVDDGSRDGSSALARQCAAAEPQRIRYLDHPGHCNLGLSASRNAGIASARGRFIALLDADDCWSPRKLEEQVALLEANPQAAMVIGASLTWRTWSGAPESDDVVAPIGAEQDALIAPPKLMTTLYPLGPGAAPAPSVLLLRREVVQAVGGFEASFRGPLMLYEDQAFLSRIYRSHAVYVASACWCRYRQRADSIVARGKASGQYWAVRSHFLRWLQRDLARSGGAQPAVQAALARALSQARSVAWLSRAARRLLPAPLLLRLRRAARP
jgi:hypothetical protein